MTMEDKRFLKPEAIVIDFQETDIIVTSGPNGEIGDVNDTDIE